MIALTEVGITDADYAAAANGGPYVTIDSTGKHLTAPDASWQEPGANTFLVWAWCYKHGEPGAVRLPILSKYDTGVAADRAWYLDMNGADPLYATLGVYNAALASLITITSTRLIPADAWAFVAGYFQPSMLMRVYAGLAVEVAVTINSLTSNVPASIQNGAAPFAVGARHASGVVDTTNHFFGRIGMFKGVCNVPATCVDEHVARVFRSMRHYYADLA